MSYFRLEGIQMIGVELYLLVLAVSHSKKSLEINTSLMYLPYLKGLKQQIPFSYIYIVRLNLKVSYMGSMKLCQRKNLTSVLFGR